MSDIRRCGMTTKEMEVLRYLVGKLPDPLPLDLAEHVRAIVAIVERP